MSELKVRLYQASLILAILAGGANTENFLKILQTMKLGEGQRK